MCWCKFTQKGKKRRPPPACSSLWLREISVSQKPLPSPKPLQTSQIRWVSLTTTSAEHQEELLCSLYLLCLTGTCHAFSWSKGIASSLCSNWPANFFLFYSIIFKELITTASTTHIHGRNPSLQCCPFKQHMPKDHVSGRVRVEWLCNSLAEVFAPTPIEAELKVNFRKALSNLFSTHASSTNIAGPLTRALCTLVDTFSFVNLFWHMVNDFRLSIS